MPLKSRYPDLMFTYTNQKKKENKLHRIVSAHAHVFVHTHVPLTPSRVKNALIGRYAGINRQTRSEQREGSFFEIQPENAFGALLAEGNRLPAIKWRGPLCSPRACFLLG